MIGLTKKQQEILSFIQDFIHRCHYSPSYREIMRHFGFSSLGSVSKHILALKQKGVLISKKQSSRSILPIDQSPASKDKSEIELPFIGILSVGLPIETFPQTQTVAVPSYLVHSPEKTYVIRARGNGLKDVMIVDEDLLLVEARNEAFAGELIIGYLMQYKQTTFVKKFFPEGNYIRLEGSKPSFETLNVKHDDIQIHGVIVGLLRLFR